MRLKWAILAACSVALAGPGFTLQQIMGYAFPTDLVAAPHDGRVAWVLNERGARNVWIAEGPSWKARRITSFTADDGQEIDEIDWLPDAHGLVYVRGGDFDTHRDDPNPASLPDGVEQAIWLSRLNADPPRKLAEGNSPAVSPQGDRVAFLKADEVWAIGLAEGDKPVQLIKTKGKVSDLRWSPDGSRLAFVSARTDHSFVGLYDPASKSLKYLDPSVDRDTNPVWSPDGTLVAFVRIPANDRAFLFGPERSAQDPWSIRVASADTGAGRELWKAQPGPGSAFHGIVAANQLFWGAGDRMVFPWEKTGWVHLYSLSTRGGAPTDLGGAGEYEVEHVSLGWDRQSVLFASNLGDIDRRHISRVSVLGENRISVTGGSGIEWSPVELSDGHGIAVLRSDFKTPAHASVVEAPGKPAVDLAPETLPADFPAPDLVEPQPVLLTATDGLPIHGQLFLPRGLKPGERRPAVIFFHGGSRRQMLLGFHYMDYYHNAYAMNQYLANLGYIVLAVNYRSGIGYGLDFREALNYGATGASEFNDVLGAGLYLRNRSDVDGARIGLWGGSYGGYLTALGLARASNLFAAGVDFHGVHDWNNVIRNFVPEYDPNRDVNAARIAFESSPMASISTWKSPVLLIHGDDDRNVPFHESIMLAEALRKQGVPFEQLVFPDEIHGFLTWRRWVEAYGASAAFLGKYLKP